MKLKSFNIMKKIDQFVINQTERLQHFPAIARLQEQYAILNDQTQASLKFLIPLLFLIGVVFINFILINSNSSLKNEIRTKAEITQVAQGIIASKNALSSNENRILSQESIENLPQIQQKMMNILNQQSIDTSKISIANFSQSSLSSNIKEVRFDFKFNGLTNDDFFRIVQVLNQNKIKIDSLQLKKSSQSNLLDGVYSLITFLKETPSED